MNSKKIRILFLGFLAAVELLAVRTAVAENPIELPEIGDPSGTLLTPSQEQELGAAFFRSLYGKVKVNQDIEIDDFIEELGERLAVASDNPLQPFRFFVVMDPEINAFAGPGGYIGVNSGLILNTESESELASVIAHEIAHVTQRHLYRAFEAARRLTIPSAAALLAGILIGTQSAEMGQAAVLAAQAASAQYQIDFTRDHEQEADRVGMQNLARSNFDPRAMPNFFERLERSSRYYGEGPPEFLRTHPVTSSRISDTRGRAEKFPYRQFLDSTPYLLKRAKLQVLTAIKPSTTIQHFESKLERGTDTQKMVARYGLGLALVAGGQSAKARP
ncbi:MAG: M48 family metallopeptidase, partial [Methylococcales bacterium]